MRFTILAVCAAALSGAAFAQTPHVTIEDDVAPANAQRCATLRVAQIGEAQRTRKDADPLVKAAHDAWMTYPGVDVAKAKSDAAPIAAAGATLQKMAADACEGFEIRS